MKKVIVVNYGYNMNNKLKTLVMNSATQSFEKNLYHKPEGLYSSKDRFKGLFSWSGV